MPPPVVTPQPAARVEPEDAEIDPRALKALSRQERRDAKSALRREQAEARNAARQAKALAKAAAKSGLPVAAAEAVLAEELEAAEHDDAADDVVETADEGTGEIPVVAEDELAAPDAAEPSTPSDPRSRAAARVQRRLGKDAEKLTAAEARAAARDEARRRRAQAKELRSGVVAAEEPVVREADEVDEVDESLLEQTAIVEPMAAEPVLEETAIIEPVRDEPILEEPVPDEPVIDESVAEEPAADEPVADESPDEEPVADESVDEEPEMARPSLADRVDEPAPVDEPVIEQPEPARVEVKRAPTPAVPTTLPMDGEEQSKSSSQLAPIAGIVGLVALGISVLLAVGALLVALGFDSGGLYNVLQTVSNILVGPLNNAFDFNGANAERKEHFLAWGAGSIGYLVLSFVGQAVQRANADDE